MPLDDPFGGGQADARRVGVIRFGLIPQRRPAVAQQQCIAGRHVRRRHPLGGQCAEQVFHRDFVAVVQSCNALVPGDIDQHAPGDDGPDVLDAQPLQAARRIHLRCGETVVEDVLHAAVLHDNFLADMPQAVELRSHLPDLGRQELLVGHDPVVPGRRAPGRQHHRVAAGTEQRHPLLVDLAQFVDLAGGCQPQRLHPLRFGDPVGRPRLVARSPLRVRPPGARLAGLGVGRQCQEHAKCRKCQ